MEEWKEHEMKAGVGLEGFGSGFGVLKGEWGSGFPRMNDPYTFTDNIALQSLLLSPLSIRKQVSVIRSGHAKELS